MFDVAIYTDTRAEESVDGADGFNFQVVSAGVTAADRSVIRERMLHSIQPGWSLTHNELDHPATCSYSVVDGRYYLARGRSTGTTNSGRAGNQLTQAIVTGDRADFVPYRPAQLFGATEWLLEKASGDPEAWIAPLEVRPEFQADGLAELVQTDSWHREILPVFLTMLGAATSQDPTKLVIVHRDLNLVMRWIALGSLFLTEEQAQVLEFRGLVANPWRVSSIVVGVSPEFDDADTRAAGANVLDLEARTATAVTVEPVAAIQADWFLTKGVVEAQVAIEIMRRWTPALGVDLAARAATIAGFAGGHHGREAWLAGIRAVTGLSSVSPDEVELYADELLDAIATYPPSTDTEVVSAARAAVAAHSSALDPVCIAVMLPTLEALAGRADLVEVWSSEIVQGWHGPLDWGGDEMVRRQTEYLLGELAMLVEPRALGWIFEVCALLTVTLPDEVGPVVQTRHVQHWLSVPAIAVRRQLWAGYADIRAELFQVLQQHLNQGTTAIIDSLVRGEWDWVEQEAPDSPLTGWVLAARLARIPPRDRTLPLADVAPRIPTSAWRAALAGIRLPADAAVVTAWVAGHTRVPDDLSELILSAAQAAMTRDEPGAAPLSSLLGELSKDPVVVTLPGLAELLAEHQAVRLEFDRIVHAVENRSEPDLAGLANFMPRWLGIRADEIGRLILLGRDQRWLGSVIELIGADAAWSSVQSYLNWLCYPGRQPGVALRLAIDTAESEEDFTASAATDFLLGLQAHDRILFDKSRMGLDWSTGDRLDKFMKRTKAGGRLSRRSSRHSNNKPRGD